MWLICGVARGLKWRVPFHRLVRLAYGPLLRFFIRAFDCVGGLANESLFLRLSDGNEAHEKADAGQCDAHSYAADGCLLPGFGDPPAGGNS